MLSSTRKRVSGNRIEYASVAQGTCKGLLSLPDESSNLFTRTVPFVQQIGCDPAKVATAVRLCYGIPGGRCINTVFLVYGESLSVPNSRFVSYVFQTKELAELYCDSVGATEENKRITGDTRYTLMLYPVFSIVEDVELLASLRKKHSI